MLNTSVDSRICGIGELYNFNISIVHQVPTFAYEKRLSRIETLRLAITYIGFMTEILAGSPPNEPNRPNDDPQRLIYPPSASHHHHNHHLHPTAIPREFTPYNHQ